MNASLLIDDLSESCPIGQAAARCYNNGPFVVLPGRIFGQVFMGISFWLHDGPQATVLAPCRWVATQIATSLDNANLPRLWSIEKTATGTVLRAKAWRKALFVGYPSAALKAFPLRIGPCNVSKSSSNARANAGRLVVVSIFVQSLFFIEAW
ncbi:hypothetical protein [Rhodoferax ferrireducens]|uniref:hypothetical protein n=1 Tax=Rhodoferax ferrireducens TaxID=192843 RepID=UPI00130038F3|nr:hypothetical protein [Rhodoferax ferrireducens]